LFINGIEELADKFVQYVSQYGYQPKIIVAQGLGFLAIGKNEKDAETAKTLFNDAIKVAVYSESFGGSLHMTQELIDFIVNWEVEAYRQKQN
jgi:rhamnose utilization protein RhaD (predicted bifunctional aldolase and dehydrogenase)